MCKNTRNKQDVGFAGGITFHNEEQAEGIVFGGGAGEKEDKGNVQEGVRVGRAECTCVR